MNRKPGDWDCGACHHLNFSRRDSCQRCGDLRPSDRIEVGSFFAGGRIDFGSFGGGRDVRPGDWYCPCGYHNFASRSNCFKCGNFKDEFSAGFNGADAFRPRGFEAGGGAAAPRSGWKSGDWICSRLMAFSPFIYLYVTYLSARNIPERITDTSASEHYTHDIISFSVSLSLDPSFSISLTRTPIFYLSI